jgi:hypothetical protein
MAWTGRRIIKPPLNDEPQPVALALPFGASQTDGALSTFRSNFFELLLKAQE